MQESDRIIPRIKAVTFSEGKFNHYFSLNLKPQPATDFILIAYLNIVHSTSVTQLSLYARLTMIIPHILILIILIHTL